MRRGSDLNEREETAQQGNVGVKHSTKVSLGKIATHSIRFKQLA